MTFTNPAALMWAALALPIVGCYLWKVRPRRVDVSTVMFWQQVVDAQTSRPAWTRLQHVLSLLVQLAVLFSLVLALAEPVFDAPTRAGRRIVLVVDNSASMRATDVRPHRLSKARDEAVRNVNQLREQDEAAIVTAGTHPAVVCRFTKRRRTLLSTIEKLPQTEGSSDVSEAVGLARRMIAGHEHGRVVVISDGCFPGAAELARDVECIPIGQSTGNVAVTRFEARRSAVDRIGYELLLEVSNFSSEPVECRVAIDRNQQRVDSLPIQLAAEGSWRHVFEATSIDGGEFVARVDHSDALAADNVARTTLPRLEHQRVILVTDGDLFLEQVLRANPLVELTVTDAAPQPGPSDSVLVFYRSVPNPPPDGHVIVVQPEHSTDLWELGGESEPVTAVRQEADSPLMTNVQFDNVLRPAAARMTVFGQPVVVASTSAHDPLLFWFERPRGRLVVWNVDLDRGDLPLRTAFPILMSNTLAWLAGTSESSDGPAPTLSSTSPFDPSSATRLDSNSVSIESDLRVPAWPRKPTRAGETRWSDQPIWFVLAASVVVLIVIEWLFHQRRWIE